MDGEWYKLAKPLMASCCDTIRNKILKRFNESSTDLSQLCVQLHRLGDVPWHHLDNVDAMQSFTPSIDWDKDTTQKAFLQHEARLKQKPSTFMARIQLEYELPK